MKMYKLIGLFAIGLTLFPAITFAAEFFASNNTDKIDFKDAFNKLLGEEQEKLQNETINVLQKEHVEQSNLENMLGAYKMSADNSEKIISSSYQNLSEEKVLKIAKKLAKKLRQESVAVFIPDKKSRIADTILKLTSHPL